MSTKLVLLTLLISAIATTSSIAEDLNFEFAGFHVTKFTGAAGDDFLNVTPATPSKIKRQQQIQLNANGTIGDLSNVDWKQGKNHAYVILPVTSELRADRNTPGRLKVTSASGLILHMRNGWLENITDADSSQPCSFSINKTAPLTKPDFTISSCAKRLVFDTGMGDANGAAYRLPKGLTKVTDENGDSCAVENSSLFVPILVNKKNTDGRLKSEAKIYQALKANPACKALDLSSLAPGRSSRSGRGSSTSSNAVQ